ncbi:MAG: ATP-grasp domain-containing protein, partial [Desulfobulbus sp.]|nr:ATP-grasp domain-containing protein [Desulfobulbus sp.]
ALAMDKTLAKVMYRLACLPVAPWVMVEPGDLRDSGRIESAVGLPCVVKPVRQGSSIGMSIVRTLDQLPAALELALRHDGEVMVEAFLKGRELTAGVLGNSELTALPLIEIIPDSRFDFFNYEAKYQPGATREVCPAPVSETVRAKAQDYALRAHRSLQLRGYSRTDMILVGEELYLLETNTIPGMTPTSLLPQAAAEAGLPFAALLDRLIELALERPAGPQG